MLDALQHSPVLVQALGSSSSAPTKQVCRWSQIHISLRLHVDSRLQIAFPFDGSDEVMRSEYPGLGELSSCVDLRHSCGFVSMLGLERTPNEAKSKDVSLKDARLVPLFANSLGWVAARISQHPCYLHQFILIIWPPTLIFRECGTLTRSDCLRRRWTPSTAPSRAADATGAH